MKTIKTSSLEFPNGNILIGVTGKDSNRMFFVKTSDGIFEYSEDEVNEIYGLVPANTNLVGVKISDY